MALGGFWLLGFARVVEALELGTAAEQLEECAQLLLETREGGQAEVWVGWVCEWFGLLGWGVGDLLGYLNIWDLRPLARPS